jgi:V/A-type H+-transporting ATPase subunit B
VTGRWAQVEHTGVTSVRDPLLVVRPVSRVGWDEFAVVRLDGPGPGDTRHGLVLEVDRDLAVLQVLEGTDGIDPARTAVAFSGEPLQIPVGPAWLGRVCNGRGEPVDGGPPVLGTGRAPTTGLPMNPLLREPPAEPVLTGLSALDGFTTLVRGQKLPVFSVAGLPHLTLATQVAAQASAGGEPFSVVFAAMGLTHADAAAVRDALEQRSAAGELVTFLNLADDPVIERLLTPRLALTVAEHLAFTVGRHVLVVMGDMTSYAEALRQVSATRGEIPARRAYPGYLYSDLASLYERCGRVRGLPGSVTVLPFLTMPAGDITHPVPDLTGYITEGQVVLSPQLDAAGVYPPVDLLGSLSRLMRKGTGPGRTREDHLDVAAQGLAALARARQAQELADLVGPDALSATDQAYLGFAERLAGQVVHQGTGENRPLEQTLDRLWSALACLPRRELTMLPGSLLDAYLPDPAEG